MSIMCLSETGEICDRHNILYFATPEIYAIMVKNNFCIDSDYNLRYIPEYGCKSKGDNFVFMSEYDSMVEFVSDLQIINDSNTKITELLNDCIVLGDDGFIYNIVCHCSSNTKCSVVLKKMFACSENIKKIICCDDYKFSCDAKIKKYGIYIILTESDQLYIWDGIQNEIVFTKKNILQFELSEKILYYVQHDIENYKLEIYKSCSWDYTNYINCCCIDSYLYSYLYFLQTSNNFFCEIKIESKSIYSRVPDTKIRLQIYDNNAKKIHCYLNIGKRSSYQVINYMFDMNIISALDNYLLSSDGKIYRYFISCDYDELYIENTQYQNVCHMMRDPTSNNNKDIIIQDENGYIQKISDFWGNRYFKLSLNPRIKSANKI